MTAPIPTMRQAMQRFSRLPPRTLHGRTSQSNLSTSCPAPQPLLFHRQPLSSQCLYLLRPARRSLHTSASRHTPEPPRPQTRIEQKDHNRFRSGPFTWKSASLFIATGATMIFYFQYEKKRLERKRVVEMSKGYGKPKVGGPFTLRDLDGNEFTEKDLLGKYTLIYFGFSHCPDICPDELDKLSAALDIIHAKHPNSVRPIFITCDPARDTPAVLREYLAEFHPTLQGLTGTWEQVKHVCKQYRVYFSTPPNLTPGEEDYLVDHSIYFYVMDPEADFVECIGRQDTPESAAAIVLEHIRDWKREGKTMDLRDAGWRNNTRAVGARETDVAMGKVPV